MQNSISFSPNAGVCDDLISRMGARLADSLDHIIDRLNGKIPADYEKIAACLSRIRKSNRISPNIYGIYHDLLIAVTQKDQGQLASLLGELANSSPATNNPKYTRYGAFDAEAPETMARYARYLDSDPSSFLDLTQPTEQRFSEAVDLAEEALRLLSRACPDLHEEVELLVSEYIFSVQMKNTKAGKFNGASCFPIWGSILLDVSKLPNPFAFAQSISHESGHLKVFLYAIDEPLVHNPPEELYPSPIRADCRPMDGNYHAVYVIARMHRTAAALASLPDIPAEISKALTENLLVYAQRFESGIEVINSHAILSKTGFALLAGACEYMTVASGKNIKLTASQQ